MSQTQQIIHRHDQFMSINYPRYPIAMVRGEGCKLYDADGRCYLDLFAGFGGSLLGHCHPDLVEAISHQARQLWHVGNLFHTEAQTQAAEAIARHGFGGRSFFCHGGADANEAAIKLARLYGQAKPGPDGHRFKILTAQNSFHGRTFGTMVATAQPKARQGFEPLLEGFRHVPYNDLKALEQAIDSKTVAIMLEPIQGEGGVNVPDDSYLPAVRRLCDQRDVLLICDEVWTGCGRTGRYFGHQHWGIEPDIMTLAKGVGGGLAVGVMCAKPTLAELYDATKHGGVRHATTLGGNCLSMAVTATIFKVLERDHLVRHAAELGTYALQRLQRFAKETGIIRQARGKGLFLGLELDCASGRSWFKSAKQVVGKCLERGVIANGTQETVLRLAPAVIIDRAQLDAGLDVIEQVLKG